MPTAAIAGILGLSVLAQPLSFADAVGRAEQHNLELVPLQLAVPQAEAESRAAGALPNPTLSVSRGPDEPTLSGTVDQKLPFLGQRSSAVAAAEAQISIAETELAARRLLLRADVRRAYFALVAAQAQLALAEDTTRLAASLAVMTAKKLEAGSAPQLDVEQAELARKRSLQDLEDRRSVLSSSRIVLATLLGLEADTTLEAGDELSKLPSVRPLAELVTASERHPEVRLAQREREAALARAHRERMSVVPVPSVSVEVERLSAPSRVGLRWGLSLDAPLWSWNEGAIKSELVQADRATARGAAARQRLAAAAREAWGRWESAVRRLHFGESELVPAAERVAKLARLSYDVGRTPFASVVLAETELAAVRSRAIDSAADAWSALADLEEAVGEIP